MVGTARNERISHRRFRPLKDPCPIDEGERTTKIAAG
jgi:hypothetical protein